MNISPAVAAARVGLSPTSCPKASTYCAPAVCASCAPTPLPASRIAATLLLLSKNSSATARRSRAAAAGLLPGLARVAAAAPAPAAAGCAAVAFPARPLRDQARLQRPAKLGGVGEAPLRVLGEAAHDRLLERDRDGHAARQRGRPAAAVALLDLRGIAPERRRARQHLVEHHAQRVDVAARIDVGAPLALLGRHVFGRPRRCLFLGRLDCARLPSLRTRPKSNSFAPSLSRR